MFFCQSGQFLTYQQEFDLSEFDLLVSASSTISLLVTGVVLLSQIGDEEGSKIVQITHKYEFAFQ